MPGPEHWEIRCKTCGLRRPATQAGLYRWGRGKKCTLVWCERCDRPRCGVVQAKREIQRERGRREGTKG